MTYVTIPLPTDLDCTELPMFEGTLDLLGRIVKPGTYFAMAEDTDGTVTIAEDGTATWRPFTRTPATVFGVRDADGDVLCDADCPATGDGEHVNPLTPATIGSLADTVATHCEGCGQTVLDYDEEGGTEDVRLAVLAATGANGTVEGTGGGCTAFIAVLPDGREVWVTDGDASRPDGIGMCAALRARDGDDDNPPILVADPGTGLGAPHDPAALYSALRRALSDDPDRDCDDRCVNHHTECDGYCDHINHVNQCLVHGTARA